MMRQDKYQCCKKCKDPGYGKCVPLGRYCQDAVDELEAKIKKLEKDPLSSDDPLNSKW